MIELVQSYLANLIDQGKSKNTVDAYRRDLKKFERFMLEENLQVEDFEELQIVSYTESLLDSGISKSSIIRNLVTLRNFYKYLRRQGHVSEAPILYYELPHLERDLPEILTEAEIQRILEAPPKDTNKGLRDRAILELLYASGLKVSELIALKLDDVDLQKRYIVLRGPKGRDRLIPLGGKAAQSIAEFLKVRSKMAKMGADNLFTSHLGSSITRQGVWKLLKAYKEAAGIQKDVNLNTLRHSFAVHLLDNGADMKAVQEMLGHTDINATLRYEELQKKNKLQEIYDKAHPRA